MVEKIYEGKNAFTKNGKREKCRDETRRGRKIYDRKNARTKKIYEQKNAQTKECTDEKIVHMKKCETKINKYEKMRDEKVRDEKAPDEKMWTKNCRRNNAR